MSGLTDEQRRRIEENRQKALARRAAAQARNRASLGSGYSSHAASVQPPSVAGLPVHTSAACGTRNTAEFTATTTRPPMGGPSAGADKAGLGVRQTHQNVVRSFLASSSATIAQDKNVSQQRSSVDANQPSVQITLDKPFYKSPQKRAGRTFGGSAPVGHLKHQTQRKVPYDISQSRHNQSGAGKQAPRISSVQSVSDGGSKVGPRTKGTCLLISTTRFEVQVGYHGKLIEMFKVRRASMTRRV